MCANSQHHICHIKNDKDKCMQVDTIYDLIVNASLYHILHISRSDIYQTQHEILTKRLSKIITICA